jgi:sterol desaturase/sphingolipid hydroxylase (fatty acid hydroxylase superfamily)
VVAVVNMGGFSLLAAPIFLLRPLIHGQDNLARDGDTFNWYRVVPDLVACGLCVDMWFYWSHRALHWKPLYKHVHKMHHRFKAPNAVAAVYAHPIEYLFGNVMGVVLGPILTNCHVYTGVFWVTFSLVSTCGSHSG